MRVILMLFFGLIIVPLSVFAENGTRSTTKAFKGVELYSWKGSASSSWSFSLLHGTNRNKILAEIKNPSGVISNVSQLEEHLATLAEGEGVFWFLRGFEPELSYPDQETVLRIVTFAAEHKIKLEIGK